MFIESTNSINESLIESNLKNIENTGNIINVNLDKKPKMRCNMCNTKVNITNSITCKCNQLLCYKHRYFNEHNCTFDHKTNERDHLTKLNQKLESNKIIKI